MPNRSDVKAGSDSKACIHRAARCISYGESVQLRVEDFDPHGGEAVPGLQRREQLGHRLFAIPWEQAPRESFADEIGVGALRRVPREPDQIPRAQRAQSISCPAKQRSMGVPSLANTPTCGRQWCIIQLHAGDMVDPIWGQLGHAAAAAEEVPAVEHDADIPKPACLDHGYCCVEIRNRAPWKELEVDREPPRGRAFPERAEPIDQEVQIFCWRKRRHGIE